MTPDREQKIQQLERVLQSRTLHNSENLKAFLRFVVEKTVDDEAVQLKEYTIATEVFGRNTDYDPRIDSVVRVQAGRLRTKLQEYYTTEGKGDELVIDLPKGHYHPVFNYSEAVPDVPPLVSPTADGNSGVVQTADVPAGLSSIPQRAKVLLFLLAGLVVILSVAVAMLYTWTRRVQQQPLAGDP